MGCSHATRAAAGSKGSNDSWASSPSSQPKPGFRRTNTIEKGLGDESLDDDTTGSVSPAQDEHSHDSRESTGSGSALSAYVGQQPHILVLQSPSVFGAGKSMRRGQSCLEGLGGGSLIQGVQGISMKGAKSGPNQDCYVVVRTNDFSLYIVCDGHGKSGHEVSNFVKDRFPPLLLQDPRIGSSKMKALMEDAFLQVTKMIGEAYRTGIMDAQKSGTTTTVVIHDHKQKILTLSHVGDSGAALAKGTSYKATYLTPDHKPNLPKERRRIESSGGSVSYDGYNYRVHKRSSSGPQLNMSRSFGDLCLSTSGVVSEPDVVQVKLKGNEHFLLVCSDGVWEFLSEQEAVNIVKDALKSSDRESAARALACAAADQWADRDVGTVDDITVVLVLLPQAPTGEEISSFTTTGGDWTGGGEMSRSHSGDGSKGRKPGFRRSDSTVSYVASASTSPTLSPKTSPRIHPAKRGGLKRSDSTVSACSDASGGGKPKKSALKRSESKLSEICKSIEADASLAMLAVGLSSHPVSTRSDSSGDEGSTKICKRIEIDASLALLAAGLSSQPVSKRIDRSGDESSTKADFGAESLKRSGGAEGDTRHSDSTTGTTPSPHTAASDSDYTAVDEQEELLAMDFDLTLLAGAGPTSPTVQRSVPTFWRKDNFV
mmetsp:Transcript_26339/g.87282  ORF Transcript_26339/g.87282 Transcript_26339/m.87282 type:complete len:656 (+) Transcript_26339:87-2054(+)